jgi:hypothetical protein
MWFLIAKLAMRFFGKGKGLAGAGYVVLNGQRVLNITTLVTVAGASGLLIAKTAELDGFGFFNILGHIMRIIFALFLICSEVAFPNYFAKNWPLFAPRHGFVMLGFAFFFLGINIFGELSHREASQKKLTMPFWQLTLAAGILSIIMAFFNMVFSYVFRDAPNGITARQVRAHGAAASQHKADVESVQSPRSVHSFRDSVISRPESAHYANHNQSHTI